VKDVEGARSARESAVKKEFGAPRAGLGLPPADPSRKKRRKKRKMKKGPGKKGLPRWFIYVAYALAFGGGLYKLNAVDPYL
jgi:hypothetical protein